MIKLWYYIRLLKTSFNFRLLKTSFKTLAKKTSCNYVSLLTVRVFHAEDRAVHNFLGL